MSSRLCHFPANDNVLTPIFLICGLRALCLRTYVPPQQISREENAFQMVKSHGNDWRRFYIEQCVFASDSCLRHSNLAHRLLDVLAVPEYD